MSEVGQEGTEFLDSQTPLEPQTIDAPEEEGANRSCLEDVASMVDRDKEASTPSVSAKSK